MENFLVNGFLFTNDLNKELGISKISEFFENNLNFKEINSLNEIIENLIDKNNLIFLSLNEYFELKSKLDNFANSISIILYDPKEELLLNDELPNYVFDILSSSTSKRLVFSINKALASFKNNLELNDLSEQYAIQSKELQTLNSIGISLSTERDVDKLLETILYKCREITESDSGSLYTVEDIEGVKPDPNNYFSNKHLVFKLAQNYTIPVDDFQERDLELNKKSISGYVAITGKPLLIQDVYHLPESSEFSHNKTFDKSIGYRCRSMLLVPMINQKDEVIGVIQLINKKKKHEIKLTSDDVVEDQVIAYDENDKDLISSIASQAAILIDNTKLYYNIKNLFEGFIKASVTAIESRDPTTSGHSARVADLTVLLAEKVDSISDGKFKEAKFTRSDLQQIKYASLLHDFGKIGVKEDVLVKAKKLYPYELELIKQRFKYIRKCMELNLANSKLDYILKNTKEKALEYFKEIEGNYKEKIEELDKIVDVIVASNEPSILAQESSQLLKEYSQTFFEDIDSTKIPYLSPYELESLSILKGSLRDNERLEIESHVTHTYTFLSKIPWTTEFKQVPDIAYSHHEKLDGTGYPRQILSENIPLPSKMMTISDIYDALTASDRPYKKALPAQKALDILGFEVKANKIDVDLYNIFVESKVYEVTNIE